MMKSRIFVFIWYFQVNIIFFISSLPHSVDVFHSNQSGRIGEKASKFTHLQQSCLSSSKLRVKFNLPMCTAYIVHTRMVQGRVVDSWSARRIARRHCQALPDRTVRLLSNEKFCSGYKHVSRYDRHETSEDSNW